MTEVIGYQVQYLSDGVHYNINVIDEELQSMNMCELIYDHELSQDELNSAKSEAMARAEAIFAEPKPVPIEGSFGLVRKTDVNKTLKNKGYLKEGETIDDLPDSIK